LIAHMMTAEPNLWPALGREMQRDVDLGLDEIA
jgi:hypothetical protein